MTRINLADYNTETMVNVRRVEVKQQSMIQLRTGYVSLLLSPTQTKELAAALLEVAV